MSIERQIESTLWLACEDLRAAQILADTQNHFAVYHVQQSAEKLIKTIHISEGVRAPHTKAHQLDEMVDLVPDDCPLKPELAMLQPLTAYATTFRYSTPGGRIKEPPNREEFDRYVTLLEDLIRRAASAFGVDLGTKGEPAANARPIR